MSRIRNAQVIHLITGVDHAGSSGSNNPTYRMFFEGGASALTETDSQVGYAATNFRPRIGEPVRPVVVTLTRAGRITHVEWAPDQYIERLGEVLTEDTTPAPTSRVRHGIGRNHA